MCADLHPGFTFGVAANDQHSLARACEYRTPHGLIQTPVYMPVGTQATVKSLDPAELRQIGAQIILANTYHLHLRPGEDLVAAHGGLHQFSGWTGPILTDSGGFQVFSLSRDRSRSGDSDNLASVDDDGVEFRSHLDRSVRKLSPETAIEIQSKLGADTIMAFDQCSPTSADLTQARDAMERTHRWAARCRARWLELESRKRGQSCQALFGIVQGGAFRELRRESATAIVDLGLPGIAVGGEAIGYDEQLTGQVLEWIADLLPADRPRYAMGVGDPVSFFTVVERGIDMFDSVLATRLARNGTLLTRDGRLRLLRSDYRNDDRPPDEWCDCPTCRGYSRSFLRALFQSRSQLAYRLATLHNVRFCLRLVGLIREAIVAGTFTGLRDEWVPRLRSGDA